MKKERFEFISLLRLMAIVLIINSHMGSIYPVSALATGGSIGNAIFFMASGYCLATPNICQPSTKFGSWYAGKIKKLYIPTLIMTPIALLTYYSIDINVVNCVRIIIWPTIYWFTGAIALYYLLFFVFRKYEGKKFFGVFFTITGLMYILYYVILLDTSKWVIETDGLRSVAGLFRLIFYFQVLMTGKYLRIHGMPIKSRKWAGLVSVIAFVSLYGFKFVMTRSVTAMHFQFFNHVSVWCMVVALFCFMYTYEQALRGYKDKLIYKIWHSLDARSFEIYLVQFLAIYLAGRLSFPLAFFAALILILIFAYVLSAIVKAVTRLRIFRF